MCFSLNDYKVEINNNQIVLTPSPREIRNYITNEEELLKINFTYSTINYCIIHDTCNDNIINIPSNYHFSRCLITPTEKKNETRLLLKKYNNFVIHLFYLM